MQKNRLLSQGGNYILFISCQKFSFKAKTSHLYSLLLCIKNSCILTATLIQGLFPRQQRPVRLSRRYPISQLLLDSFQQHIKTNAKSLLQRIFTWLQYVLHGNNSSASERSIRTFCIGKKSWMFHDSVVGAESSAIIYSISETAKLNNLRPYYYFKHLLTELPKMVDENRNMGDTHLDKLLPWTEELPEECRKNTPQK